MILVFGGVYQGKSEFVKEKFNYKDEDFYNCKNDINFEYNVLFNFEKFILQLVNKNEIPMLFIENSLNKFKDKIIIFNEISSGIVPTDENLRKWREETGRSMVILSKNANEVYRVFCGIATKIK